MFQLGYNYAKRLIKGLMMLTKCIWVQLGSIADSSSNDCKSVTVVIKFYNIRWSINIIRD